MRIFLLASATPGDYDTETVLDAGFPYSSLAKAQAAAQAECDEIAEVKTPLAWGARISNLSTWTTQAEGTIWRIRECCLDG